MYSQNKKDVHNPSNESDENNKNFKDVIKQKMHEVKLNNKVVTNIQDKLKDDYLSEDSDVKETYILLNKKRLKPNKNVIFKNEIIEEKPTNAFVLKTKTIKKNSKINLNIISAKINYDEKEFTLKRVLKNKKIKAKIGK